MSSFLTFNKKRRAFSGEKRVCSSTNSQSELSESPFRIPIHRKERKSHIKHRGRHIKHTHRQPNGNPHTLHLGNGTALSKNLTRQMFQTDSLFLNFPLSPSTSLLPLLLPSCLASSFSYSISIVSPSMSSHEKLLRKFSSSTSFFHAVECYLLWAEILYPPSRNLLCFFLLTLLFCPSIFHPLTSSAATLLSSSIAIRLSIFSFFFRVRFSGFHQSIN